ncbi:MAG: hypothetical protein ACHQ53_15570 [Polyangiales bacterium]
MSKETKSLGLAGAVLLAFAAMMAWMMAGPSGAATSKTPALPEPQSARPPAPTNASSTEPGAKAASAAATEPAAADLFAGPMPDFMVDCHRRVLDKELLDVEDEKKLYAYGQAHKDDARPQLLLAWESMNREWYGIASRMYGIAYRADPRAKDDPTMLRDLLLVASMYDKTEFDETKAIIADAYGATALPRLDQALFELRSQGDGVGAARLQRLREALSAH